MVLDERYTNCKREYKKFNLCVLIVCAVSLIMAIIAFFVPFNEVNGQKFVNDSMARLWDVYHDENLTNTYNEYLEKNSEKATYSLRFSAELISNYFDDNEPETGDIEAAVKRHESAQNYYKIVNAYSKCALLLASTQDKEEFLNKVYAETDSLSECKRNVSLFELSVRILPETAFGGGSKIFYADYFGTFLITIPWVILIFAFSMITNLVQLIKSTINVFNIEAATKRFHIRCTVKSKKNQRPEAYLKAQGSYIMPVYLFAYILAILAPLLTLSAGIFASNYCSCLPLMTIAISPLAYVILVLEAVAFFFSFKIGSSKCKIRDSLMCLK